MQYGGKESQYSEILALLKKLPDDDRIFFSLQLYEGLTSQQAQEVLHLNAQNNTNPKKNHKKYKRSTAKSL